MKEFIKNYFAGIIPLLILIILIVQPWYFGQLIGMKMNQGVGSYIIATLLELVFVGVFILFPYTVGRDIRQSKYFKRSK